MLLVGSWFSTKQAHFLQGGTSMSRTVTPPLAQPTTPQVKLPHDKVAMRAYEKWVKQGRPPGRDVQNWLEAEAELRAEFARSPGATPPRR
jgi:hypothetical protein